MPKLPGLLPFVGGPAIRPMFRALGIAASGMSAQRTRIEVAASNLANADVTRGENGKAYNRRIVQLSTAQRDDREASFRFPNQLPFAAPPFGTAQFDVPAGAASSAPAATDTEQTFGVVVQGIQEDTTAGARVHMPGHPDADAEGYVTLSNVNRTSELVDLLDARRVFEANATVFQSAKQILRKSLEL
ncbi:MAG: flagellar basal body rod protein FlgC [Gemmatimonadaceae bacterium]|nr:flagellar basal body rod protein FlgC [Gemmatimonadaceae bacterium]